MRTILMITFVFALIQSLHATEPTPITKEAFIKFKSVKEILAIPSSYVVVQFSFSLITKGEVYTATCNSDTLSVEFKALINGLKSGDKISFQDVIVTKDTRRIKLEGKYFVFL